jgi:hypothetical protein
MLDTQGSFCTLVRECAADITPKAMARELERIGAIKVTPRGMMRLIPAKTLDLSARQKSLRFFSQRLAEFGREMYKISVDDESAMYANLNIVLINSALRPLFLREYEERVEGVLQSMKDWVSAHSKAKVAKSPTTRVGLGAYFFEPPVSELGSSVVRMKRRFSRTDRGARTMRARRPARPA